MGIIALAATLGDCRSGPKDLTMAERTGLEPATPGVTGRYSNQLNYRSVVGVAGLEPATYGL